MTAPILGAMEAEDRMSDWDTNWSRDALERIVVLLFALANLADLAAGASFLRRRRVVGILSHGEAEARAFVVGMVSGAPAPVNPPASADDAACLAVRLRALALALCVLLARWFALPGAAGPCVGRPSHKVSGPSVRWLGAPAPPAPDTS
jgi:hypothetical protein